MAGIDKITKEILQDAEKEAASIIAGAEKSAASAREKQSKECDALRAEADEKLERKLAAERKKIVSQCEQIEKLCLLKTKQEIVEQTLLQAKAKLLMMEPDAYFDTLLSMMEGSLYSGDGRLCLGQKDLDRVSDDFVAKASQLAAKSGGTLTLSKEPVNIDGGFILKYGNIEINSSLDAVFDERRDEFTDIVNSILWNN